MSATVFEVLENAEHNCKLGLFGLVQQQLHNVIVLIRKGYGVCDDASKLLAGVGSVEDVPEKQEGEPPQDRRVYHEGSDE